MKKNQILIKIFNQEIKIMYFFIYMIIKMNKNKNYNKNKKKINKIYTNQKIL